MTRDEAEEVVSALEDFIRHEIALFVSQDERTYRDINRSAESRARLLETLAPEIEEERREIEEKSWFNSIREGME